MSPATVAIIPARYGSTRLPGKALADIAGRPMVWHVAERARRARGIARVIVATDDVRIRDAVAGSGVEVALTSPDHPSGTDRLAEVARGLDADVLINVQGDLPLLDPLMIEALAARMAADPALPMATIAAPLLDEAEWRSPHVVKVVVDARRSRALLLPQPRAVRPRRRCARRTSPSAGDTSACTPTAARCCCGLPRCRRRRSSVASGSSSCARSSTASRSEWWRGAAMRR